METTPEPTHKRPGGFLDLFKPSGPFFVTPILMELNFLVFIIMVASGVSAIDPDVESLLAWGADFRPLTLSGQWWRLITNCFLHIGFVHLLMNMYALWYIGMLLERHLGRVRFLAAYLATGVIASMASICWHEATVSAGASGAIFGMYGVFLSMLTTNLLPPEGRKGMLASIVIFVVYNLAYGMKGTIDNAAHIGGLLSGMVIGYAFYPGLKRGANGKKPLLLTVTVLAAAVVVVTAMGLRSVSNDIGTWQTRIDQFYQNQERAVHVLRLPDNATESTRLQQIRDTAIPLWKENIRLVTDLEKLRLPEHVRARDRLLLEYSRTYLETMQVTYRTLDEQTDRYGHQLDSLHKRIGALIDSLK